MVAMIFLLYDLCITPVAIAWDFPMSGWLLRLDTVLRRDVGFLLTAECVWTC